MAKSADAGTGEGIEIRNLYKIFGSNPEAYVSAVREGMSKSELIQQHGHVLGLNNINISMPAGSIQVIMGLSGSGKSTLIRHINRLIEPSSGKIYIEGRDERPRAARAPGREDWHGLPIHGPDAAPDGVR